MIIAKKITLFTATLFILQSSLFSHTKAVAQFHDGEFLMEQQIVGQQSTYVTYRTDPEHYDVAGNATRTCGPGYNPMDRQHRKNHQYKRPHSHPYVPWRPTCAY